MGQSVKDAFGIDMSGISVAALESDAGLREHLFMACLAEMASRGSVDALEDTPDAVYVCAKGLFGVGYSDVVIEGVWKNRASSVRDFLRETKELVDVRCTEKEVPFVLWLCNFLDYAGRRLHIDMLPSYVTTDWFFEVIKGWLRLVADGICPGRRGLWAPSAPSVHTTADNLEWVFLRVLNGDYFYGFQVYDAKVLELGAIGLSKLCLGSRFFKNSCVYVGCDAGHSGDDRVLGEGEPFSDHMFVNILFSDYYYEARAYDGHLGLLLQWFFSVRFLKIDCDVFDFELEEHIKAVVGSKEFLIDCDGSAVVPRLYLIGRGMKRHGADRYLFLEGSFSGFCERLSTYGVRVLSGCGSAGFGLDSSYYRCGYFRVASEFRDAYNNRRCMRDWIVLKYDPLELKQHVSAVMKLEGSPLWLVDPDLLSYCRAFPYPLMGQRRLTPGVIMDFYPEGVKVWVKKLGHDASYPFLVMLENIGLYYVLEDRFMAVFLNRAVHKYRHDGEEMVDSYVLGEGKLCIPLNSSLIKSYFMEPWTIGFTRNATMSFGFVEDSSLDKRVLSGGIIFSSEHTYTEFFQGKSANCGFCFKVDRRVDKFDTDSFTFMGDMSVFDKYYS